MSYQQDPKDFNAAGMYALVGSVVVSCLFFGYISFLHPGVHYDTIREADAPAVQLASFDPSTVNNPWVSSEDMIKFGAKKYKTYCSSCHGESGNGMGPAAAGLIPPPRNLIAGDWKHGGDTLGLFKLIMNGAPGTSMAGYGATFPAAEIWAMVHFVQSITNNKKLTDNAQLEAFAKSQ